MKTDQALAEILPDAVLVLDKRGKLLWHNSMAENLLDLKNAPKNLQMVLKSTQLKKAIHEHTQATIDLVAPHRDETRLALTLIPYGATHFVLIAKDITHTHHLENMRQDFVANVSHELRTPLTVVHGYLETILEENPVALQPWRKVFEQMMQQSLRMEQLVQDLLLLSRLETAQPEQQSHQRVAMNALLTAIVDDAHALSGAQSHRIHLQVNPKLDLYGQVDELRSAFSNLVFNAVHYTPANGNITVTWDVDDKGAYLSVQDTGIGIASKHLPRITERFYRVDKARSRASGGTGLGLAIVKHVLLRHDAQLNIISQLGQGSCFTCHFPMSRVVLHGTKV